MNATTAYYIMNTVTAFHVMSAATAYYMREKRERKAMEKKFDEVLSQMDHLSYKNWECGCPRNPAIWKMSNNHHRDD